MRETIMLPRRKKNGTMIRSKPIPRGGSKKVVYEKKVQIQRTAPKAVPAEKIDIERD